MSLATLAWSAGWTLMAATACVRLLRAASQPEPLVRNGYRWLAVAAACLAVGGIVQQAFGGLIGGAQPLRLADLISLAALPALVLGLATLSCDPASNETGAARLPRSQAGAVPGWTSAGPSGGTVVDSCLLVSSLFAICLVTMFGSDYATADAGRAAFMLALIRPAADLVVLGLLLRYTVRGPRRTLLPVLALGVIILGDSLAVGDRIAGAVPGIGARVCLLSALGLLALAPATMPAWAMRSPGSAVPGSAVPGSARPGGSWSSTATIAALAAASAAALIVTGFSLSGARVGTPALAITGSIVVLLLVARLAGLVRHALAVAEFAHESGEMFRALADTTSDVVLICDQAGTVEYVSRAIADFGYAAAELTGKRLADLVHPEDRPAGVRAGVSGLRTAAGATAFAGRIRGADGSWRHVEATLSRYGATGSPARLLITSRDVSDRVALRRQVTQLAFHDGLTGLPNRAYVEERVKDLSQVAEQRVSGEGNGHDPAGPDHATREPGGHGPVVAAMLVDLDGFASVNDLLGSTGADLLLAQAGRRLRAAVPPPATVARWGSDEFAILVADAATAREAIDLAERVAGLITADPFAIGAKEITMTVSIGVATSDPDGADLLLDQAGVALSKAKESGVGRIEVFAAQLHAQARHRAELAGELAQAIAEHRLELGYLPVAELATGRVRGVEAVARWVRPGEEIGPDELRGIAEESGLSSQLGDAVLDQACRQVAAWRAQGWDIGLSVRCSARHVTGSRFVRSVLAALEQAELPPQALTLEVEERVVVDGAASVAASLAGLRGKGIKLALGSFGTEYASLAHLRRSAVDVITIDSSFVAGLETDLTLALLTRTVVQLAHDLGIEVIAAGIERASQREQLQAMGCELGQGPGIAGLMAAADPVPTLAGQGEDQAEPQRQH